MNDECLQLEVERARVDPVYASSLPAPKLIKRARHGHRRHEGGKQWSKQELGLPYGSDAEAAEGNVKLQLLLRPGSTVVYVRLSFEWIPPVANLPVDTVVKEKLFTAQAVSLSE